MNDYLSIEIYFDLIQAESSLFCTLKDYTDEYGIPDISKMFKTDLEP